VLDIVHPSDGQLFGLSTGRWVENQTPEHDDEEATMATQQLVRPIHIPAPRGAQVLAPRPVEPPRDRTAPSVRVGASLEARTTTYQVVQRPAEGSARPRRDLVARPAGAQPQGVRLTRRGRLLVTGTAVVLLLLALVLLRPGGPAFAGDSERGPATRTVVVQPGQTMWQIARDIRPGADPRDTVRRIQELNGLTTAQVWAGQPLVVPS
jgi:nucleoid-associated protein YgaU